ncbi:MAG: hypothetical protein WDO24_01265 [Pseudomonadota bacterium]
MERLINDILKRGGQRNRLEVKVFGGGNVMHGAGTVGSQNARFVRSYLETEGLPIEAQHLEGDYPRRVHYFPHSGRAWMLELKRAADVAVVRGEVDYLRSLSDSPVAGSVELFE